jgi:hypothetical protein
MGSILALRRAPSPIPRCMACRVRCQGSNTVDPTKFRLAREKQRSRPSVGKKEAIHTGDFPPFQGVATDVLAENCRRIPFVPVLGCQILPRSDSARLYELDLVETRI